MRTFRLSRVRRPSSAMIVALLALFVALGDSSYAALTNTGKDAKNGTLALAAPAGVARSAYAAPQTLGDGAWCWFADPRGVRYDGLNRRTYVGWVAEDGDIKVSGYDQRGGTGP